MFYLMMGFLYSRSVCMGYLCVRVIVCVQGRKRDRKSVCVCVCVYVCVCVCVCFVLSSYTHEKEGFTSLAFLLSFHSVCFESNPSWP